MFCPKYSCKKIDRIRERSLKLILKDYTSDFSGILQLTNASSIHQNFLNTLMLEIYKYLHGLSPSLMNDIFLLRENTYYIGNSCLFKSNNPKSRKYGYYNMSATGTSIKYLLILILSITFMVAHSTKETKSYQENAAKNVLKCFENITRYNFKHGLLTK